MFRFVLPDFVDFRLEGYRGVFGESYYEIHVF